MRQLCNFFPLLACLFINNPVYASSCDNALLTVNGPDNYQYSINMFKGTIGQKDNNNHVVPAQSVSPYSTSYHVFAEKGSHGNVRGVINFIDKNDPSNQIVSKFNFITNGRSCRIYSITGKNNNFIALTTIYTSIINYQLKEFKN